MYEEMLGESGLFILEKGSDIWSSGALFPLSAMSFTIR